MARFEPQPGDQISLNSTTYEVMPHPAAPTMAFGQEGRKAIVYQLRNNGRLFALKIFKSKFRQAHLVDTCQVLSQLTLPGLEVCTRQCLTRDTAAPLLRQYADMEYAVLMPWIQGATWFDMVFAKTNINRDAAKQIAQSTANVLAELEALGFAHCDVAGTNVIVNMGTGAVSFIDVEDMFGPGFPSLSAFPQGTAGYQHRASRTTKRGQWCVEGDRFSAAVLLAEMLAWHDPQIRRASDKEHFFAEAELQDPHNPRYQLMVDVLAGTSREVADCFAYAWTSTTLTDCPPLSKWAKLLEFPLISKWLPIQAPPPPPPYKPKAWIPIIVPPEPEKKPVAVDAPRPDEGRAPPSERPSLYWGSGVFKSSQSLDYAIEAKEFSRLHLRYLYARSADSRASGGEGQDYLAWRCTEDTLGFVICDGVGSSFYGNVAARYLGERLIDHLLFDVGPELEKAPNTSALAEYTAKYLNRWQDGAHRRVQAIELPSAWPPLALKTLGRLKQEHGSETVFVCGRLSFGEKSARLTLIWMGDAEVRLFDRWGRRVEIGGVWRNSDRWSTRRGIRGQVHAWMGDVEEHKIERIVAFSDGLSAIADRLDAIEDGELQRAVGEQLISPSSGDISFIDIRLKPLAGLAASPGVERAPARVARSSVESKAKVAKTLPVETKEDLLPPYLFPIDNPDGRDWYKVGWTPVRTVRRYILCESQTPDFAQEEQVYQGPSDSCLVKDKEPGVYYYRVFSCDSKGRYDPQKSSNAEQTVVKSVIYYEI